MCTELCCKAECVVICDPVITSYFPHMKCLVCFEFTRGCELLSKDLYRGERDYVAFQSGCQIISAFTNLHTGKITTYRSPVHGIH